MACWAASLPPLRRNSARPSASSTSLRLSGAASLRAECECDGLCVAFASSSPAFRSLATISQNATIGQPLAPNDWINMTVKATVPPCIISRTPPAASTTGRFLWKRLRQRQKTELMVLAH